MSMSPATSWGEGSVQIPPWRKPAYFTEPRVHIASSAAPPTFPGLSLAFEPQQHPPQLSVWWPSSSLLSKKAHWPFPPCSILPFSAVCSSQVLSQVHSRATISLASICWVPHSLRSTWGPCIMHGWGVVGSLGNPTPSEHIPPYLAPSKVS